MPVTGRTGWGGWPLSLYAMAVGSFAIGTTEFLPSALLTTIARDLRVDLAAAGLLISGYAMGVTIMTPLLAAGASRLPRKRVMMILMGLFALTNGLAALAPGYGFLLAMRFLTSFSHGLYFAVASTAVGSLVPADREAQGISVLFSGLTIAMATIVPVGAWIGQAMGWRVAFAGTGLLGLAAVAGIALHVPDLPPGAKGVSLAEQARLLANPRLLLAFLMTAVGYAGAFATFSYLPAILEKVTGFAPAMVTVLLAMVGLGVTAGNLLGGRVADRGIFGAIAGLYGMVAAGLLALWLGAPYPAAAVLVLIFLSVVIFSPGAGLQMLAVRQARRFAPGAEDVAAGLNQSAFNLGIAAGAFVASRVVRSSLGLAGTPLASIALVLCAIGLTGLAWWLERRPAGEPSGLNYEEVGPKPLPGTAIAPDLLS